MLAYPKKLGLYLYMAEVLTKAFALPRTLRERKSTFLRILSYLKRHRSAFLLALFCMVLFGASDGILPFLVKYILDAVFVQQNQRFLYLLPILVVLLALLRAVFDFGQQFLMTRTGHRIVEDLRNDISSHLLKLSSDFFVRNSSGSLLSRITSDVVLVRTLLTESVAALIRDTVRIVALIIAAFILDPVLALMAFVVFPVAVYPVYIFGRKIRKLSKRGQDSIGSLSALFRETLSGHKVIKIFGRERFEEERFKKANNELTLTFEKAEKIRAMTGPINEVLASLAIAAIILYGGFSVIGGYRTQGDFIAFLISVFLLYDPFKKLSKVHHAIQQGLSGADRVFEVMDAPILIADPATPQALPSGRQVELKNVTFAYPGSGGPALKGVTFSIAEGEKVALVGFSGAGKSTLVDLIPRFMDPQRGQVLVGGVDVRNLKLDDLRSQIAMVGQHTFLFNDTVANNIAYGREGATEEEIVRAARAAYAYDFISRLPNGFASVIAEDGLTLSGGERQRLAIARAILKDAPILILDEATASLDNRAEREVQAALAALEKGRSTIVIAHRLSTVQSADKIVVLKDGEIAEMGSHRELLEKKGEYGKLYALQNLDLAGQVSEPSEYTAEALK